MPPRAAFGHDVRAGSGVAGVDADTDRYRTARQHLKLFAHPRLVGAHVAPVVRASHAHGVVDTSVGEPLPIALSDHAIRLDAHPQPLAFCVQLVC